MAIIGCVGIILTVFLGDLWIKGRVERYVQIAGKQDEKREILGGKAILQRYHNRGAMLNLGENRRALVAAISVIFTILLLLLFLVSLGKYGNKLLRVGLSFILGGAFSNTYDRLKRKYVVDYVSFQVPWKALRRVVFNISDFCILIGSLLTVLASISM